LGEWKSAYQGIDEQPNTWVSEDLTISVGRGEIKIKNANSSHDYDYTAYGKILERVYLSGNWVSIRPGANAHGAFILTISAQGNMMYGYWVGPDLSGSRRYGRWVLSRNASMLDEAKALLEEMRKSRQG